MNQQGTIDKMELDCFVVVDEKEQLSFVHHECLPFLLHADIEADTRYWKMIYRPTPEPEVIESASCVFCDKSIKMIYSKEGE